MYGAIIEVVNTNGGVNNETGVRKNGSTDNRHPDLDATFHTFRLVGLDDDEIFEGYAETGNVDFYRIDRRIVKTPADFRIVFDRRPANIRDESCFGKIQLRKNIIDDRIYARILQTNRIQHSHRRLVYSRCRIAQPWLERSAFQHHRTGGSIREAGHTRVFFSESDTTGQQHDR